MKNEEEVKRILEGLIISKEEMEDIGQESSEDYNINLGWIEALEWVIK